MEPEGVYMYIDNVSQHRAQLDITLVNLLEKCKSLEFHRKL